MSSRLLLETIAGRPTARRPLWIMRQAGRYLPEYRELRAKYGFKELAQSPELATEITLMPIRRFELDAAIVFADIMSPLPALGIDFDFDPGPVVANPIRDEAGIDALREPALEEVAPEVIRALQMTRAELPDSTALLGFCGAPWTLAAYLVEGRGTKDFPTLRAFAAARPDLLDRLLARLSKLMGEYLIAQAKAGADAVQVFDSWAGVLSVEEWERLIRPHLTSLLETVGAAGVPRILFLQNAPHLVDAYASLPAEVLAVDWRVDLAVLKQRLGERSVQGNIDPAVLLAGPDATREAARTLLASVEARGHIVNLGHGILPQTPIESVEALIEVVHSESTPATGDTGWAGSAAGAPANASVSGAAEASAPASPGRTIQGTLDSAEGTMAEHPTHGNGSPAASNTPPPLDIGEKGRRDGEVITLDRRLFMKFTAFGDCKKPHKAVEALRKAGITAALYIDAADPHGIGVMAASEDPEFFVTTLREVFNEDPFDDYEYKPEFDMLGRSYSIGYEPDLENVLLQRPLRRLLDPANLWAVWYPLQRSKGFQRLPADHQQRILAEHGTLARRFGEAGLANDIRLACHGLDRYDNDFIIGLVGPTLHPLSAVVQEMRKTEQTAQYLDNLGPFFVGRVAWQSPYEG